MGDYEDRKDYSTGSLQGAEESMAERLTAWLEAARAADPEDYNAMPLSTVDAGGHPDARIVLLRDVDREGSGFLFYTNYASAKGKQLAGHPSAALTFFPRPSRIGAWASQQSESIADRKALEAARAEVEARFPGDVPRPPHWGGYRLVADAIEFWQGRPGRLHDRIRCTRQGESWIQERLQP